VGIPASQWTRIWEHVTREFQCDCNSIHGPSHWRRVERNGLLLATRTGAIEEVVRLFAVFHDSRREHDGHDLIHGSRAAVYATSFRDISIFGPVSSCDKSPKSYLSTPLI
jgi:uncharacterized protein